MTENDPSAAAQSHSVGPIELAPGVTPRHLYSYLFAATLSIGMFTYLVSLTPFILSENLGIPESEHGRIIGNLQFLQEIVMLISIGWWGAISDRVGRRAVYFISWIIMGVGYSIYAFATSIDQLFIFRIVYALAIAASTTTLSTILGDYPREESRGKLSGITFFLNGVGAVFFFVGMSKLPAIFQEQGADAISAGRYAFLIVAAMAFVTAIVMTGLKPGRPEGVKPKTPALVLMKEGLLAARNKRIALAYFGSFAARADMIVITLFLVLWVVQSSVAEGLSAADAQARAGMYVGITSGAAVVWAPLFGYLSDKMDRVHVMVIGFLLAGIGYTWLGFLTDVTSFSATIPALIFVGIGQTSTILATTVLLGKEAPAAYRGSVFGMLNLFGAIGILGISTGGGYLYDLISPGAPFVTIGIANTVVFFVALLMARRSSKTA